MIILIDTNILVSAALESNSDIYRSIIDNASKIDFVVPEFAINEIASRKAQICFRAKRNIEVFQSNLTILLSYTLILSDDYLSDKDIRDADHIAGKIDVNDVIFVAFSIAFNCLIWTGDRKLVNGVRKAGFQNIISTKEFKDILKGL